MLQEAERFMEKIVWDDKYKIGVPLVDKAHSRLFRIMGKMLSLSTDTGIDPHTYKEGLKYLEGYTMTHFSEEESFMRSIRYANYGQHKRIHDNFRDKTLVSLKRDLDLSNYSPTSVQRFMSVMSNWLTEHIMKEDQAIVGKGPARKGNNLSSQIATISLAVNRYTTELFQIESKLTSSEYKGQNIGNAFYSYQCYDIEGDIRLRLLLGIEEPLILRGVNKIYGTQITQSDDLPDGAVLKIFEQLFQDTGKLFLTEAQDKFGKDNLLTRDEFRTDFMKGYPCSLLFGTKIGSLVFCYRSWRNINKK